MTERFTSSRRTEDTCISAVTEMKRHCQSAVQAGAVPRHTSGSDINVGSCKSCRLKCRRGRELEDGGERNKGAETCGVSEILPPGASWAINCLSKSQQAAPVICFLGNGTHSITHNSLDKQRCSVLVSSHRRVAPSYKRCCLNCNLDTDAVTWPFLY